MVYSVFSLELQSGDRIMKRIEMNKVKVMPEERAYWLGTCTVLQRTQLLLPISGSFVQGGFKDLYFSTH